MTIAQWSRSILLIGLGLFVVFCSYKIDEATEEEIYIQQHSPVISMPVVYRLKGWGTIKVPNKLYVRYRGKEYGLRCSNKYFSQVARQDRVDVSYDSLRDKAVLANVQISRHYVLYGLMALSGLIITCQSLIDLRRQLMKK